MGEGNTGRDPAKARSLFEESKRADDPIPCMLRAFALGDDSLRRKAAMRLGLLFSNPFDDEEDIPISEKPRYSVLQSMKWFRRAAELGVWEGAKELACLHLLCGPESSRREEAEKWRKEAVRLISDSPDAGRFPDDIDNSLRYAERVRNERIGFLSEAERKLAGPDSEQDAVEGERTLAWLASTLAFPKAASRLALCLLAKDAERPAPEAVAGLSCAAQLDDPEALAVMGECRRYGLLGVRKDLRLANALIDKAEKLGSARAVYLRGRLLDETSGEAASRPVLERAAGLGEPDAWLRLARFADSAGNPAEALWCVRKAVDLDSPAAWLELGARQRLGRGTPPDPKEALEWLRKAAFRGLPRAWLEYGAAGFQTGALDAESVRECVERSGMPREAFRKLLDEAPDPARDRIDEAASSLWKTIADADSSDPETSSSATRHCLSMAWDGTLAALRSPVRSADGRRTIATDVDAVNHALWIAADALCGMKNATDDDRRQAAAWARQAVRDYRDRRGRPGGSWAFVAAAERLLVTNGWLDDDSALLDAAARHGSIPAMKKMAKTDRTNLGFFHLERAASLGDPEARRMLADVYRTGAPFPWVKKDERKAEELYGMAARDEDPEAQWRLGTILRARGDSEKAFRLFVQAARTIPEALFEQSMCQRYGIGTEENDYSAEEGFEKINGDGESRFVREPSLYFAALRELAKLRLERHDESGAFLPLKRAALIGKDREALKLFGINGRIRTYNDRAERTFRAEEAARTGDPESMVAAGRELLRVGGKVRQASRWFRKAAEAGNAEGSYEWARCLLFGDGVEPDRRAAKKWFEKAAAKAGDPKDERDLSALARAWLKTSLFD